MRTVPTGIIRRNGVLAMIAEVQAAQGEVDSTFMRANPLGQKDRKSRAAGFARSCLSIRKGSVGNGL